MAPQMAPTAPEGTLPPIQPTAHFVPVPDDVAEDQDKLFELFGERFSASNCNISRHYTYRDGLKLIRGRKDDCIIIFRNRPDKPTFFVLRVYKLDPVINGKKYKIPGRTDGEYNYIDHI
ncbi:hypothetical protein ISF_07412 [Cordyceps fumosorosea ARSEF 2679]|uniref:Uncharacterized protein n=1 Tax=Cordyceps fumosorosea (strain ARSEF 2679) TaxID=1081104 RepID=A0A167PPQ5_CORFA|nr:hypothetical protein ISF_07412 [Cordyceps fumosorosea ARSEF 2679]OAA56896.1 hypothetical protein ISF_07412 [Cordyceps fumosorosea ARSEF 2679]